MKLEDITVENVTNLSFVDRLPLLVDGIEKAYGGNGPKEVQDFGKNAVQGCLRQMAELSDLACEAKPLMEEMLACLTQISQMSAGTSGDDIIAKVRSCLFDVHAQGETK